MLPSQFIPKIEEPLHITYFRDSLTVARIHKRPKRAEGEVTVLPKDIDALASNKFRNPIDHIPSCDWIAHIKQAILYEWSINMSFKVDPYLSNKPFRVFNRQRRSNHCTFNFKPEQKLHTLCVGCIAYRP